jgi:Ca2+-binding RTX toxin-like protein
MAQQVISTTISAASGSAVTLSTDDADLRVTSTGEIESIQADGIKGSLSNQDVIIEGKVTAAWSAVALGMRTTSTTANTVVVEATGDVHGGIYGVVLQGTQMSVDNRGTIDSDDTGVAFLSTGTGASSLVNSGTITGAATGVSFSGTESFTFTNSGLVDAGSHLAFTVSGTTTGNVTIINTGRIVGSIALGEGDDVFDGSAGTIKGGILFGGDGDDTLIGGSNGDGIIGDLGRDILTGGGGADIFLFDGSTESSPAKKLMDQITDFSQRKGDTIDLSGIDAKTGGSSNDTFRFIGDDDFHQRQGELRYEIGNGRTFVYGDYDGDGKADFGILLVGEIDLKKSDFVL